MANCTITCLQVGPLGVNCYLVSKAGECVIVDPGGDAERIIEACGAFQPKAVLLTHAHFDHIGAVDEVCGHFGIPLYVHPGDAPKLLDPVLNAGAQYGYRIVANTEPLPLADGETLHLAGMDIAVLHTPGHSAGSVCFLLPENAGILTGDTLFAHGYGRTDFIDGDFGALMDSLRKLFHLQPQITAYPGHEEIGWAGRNPEGNEL